MSCGRSPVILSDGAWSSCGRSWESAGKRVRPWPSLLPPPNARKQRAREAAAARAFRAPRGLCHSCPCLVPSSPSLGPDRSHTRTNMATFGAFGSTQQPQQQQTGSIFGGGGAFGSNQTTAPATGGSLFGNSAQQNTNPGGGLFGSTAANNPTGATTGGLFGSTQPSGGGLFGANTGQQQQPQTGGLFGNSAQQSTTAPSGGLFGSTQPAQQGTSLLCSYGSCMHPRLDLRTVDKRAVAR